MDTDHLTDEQRQQGLLHYCRAASREIAELTDGVPWKWWARCQAFDARNARVEIVDLFHFVISLAQVMGLGAEEACTAYTKKHHVNLQRQDSGCRVKDEPDHRHI